MQHSNSTCICTCAVIVPYLCLFDTVVQSPYIELILNHLSQLKLLHGNFMGGLIFWHMVTIPTKYPISTKLKLKGFNDISYTQNFSIAD